MTPIQLSDLDRRLARGPCLAKDAAIGACVGVLMGWFHHDRTALSNAFQGAVAGMIVCLGSYGYDSWASHVNHVQAGKV